MEYSKIVIDLSGVKTIDDIHDVVSKSFAFPEYYGRNLDALYDSLSDFASSKKTIVSIVGDEGLNSELATFVSKMLTILYRVHCDMSNSTGDFNFVVGSCCQESCESNEVLLNDTDENPVIE